MINEEKAALQEARRRARRRTRRMAFFTLLVAGFYLFGTDLILNGGDRWHLNWDGIRHTNAVRAVVIHFFPLPSAQTKPDEQRRGVDILTQLGSPPPRPGSAPTLSPEQRQAYERGLRELAAVEGTAWVWERVMWALCTLLVAVALLSWVTPWGRLFHLLGAAAIIVVTFFSLACLRYLELPDSRGQSLWPLSLQAYAALMEKWDLPEGGGLPPLLPRTYLALAAILSTYGWVLVGVFARRIRPAAIAPAASPHDAE